MKSALRTAARRGFTLIELIITIVIIGILAAVAIPKFQNLSTEANLGVVRGAAAAVASATSVNYAKRQASTATGSALTSCADVQTNLAALADVPAGITVGAASGGNTALVNTGATAQCSVTHTASGATVDVGLYGSI